MVSNYVAAEAVLYCVGPGAGGSPGESVMRDFEFWKSASIPTKHVGFHFVHRVPTGHLIKPSDAFPTSAPINLACAPHMEPRIGFHFQPVVHAMADNAATDAESWVVGKCGKAALEVVLWERNISVKLNDEVPVIRREMLIAFVKCFDDAAPG